MIKCFKISSWIMGILTSITILMITIGGVYNIPLGTLYEDIFKPIFISCIFSILIWTGVYCLGVLTGKFDNWL